MSSLANRAYHLIRHPSAQTAARGPVTVQGFSGLQGHKYCLLVTYRRSGEPVPTPVWFGLAEGSVYIRSEADAAKVARIRRDARARLAPCTARGKPLGPPAEGRARVLEGPEQARAEAALQANYGRGRRAYEGVADALGVRGVYLEVVPA
ncbi:MAG TPA: PPOX class F420-dependent oxidoreductase [Solirubrobacteraceae bacterium]|nr:PPOX class F420-dependent oxidoreductase [Solirubrobacteraceae bacterium]